MKKVLFISPNFFNYSEIIKDELINQGYTVDWFDDRPSTSIIDKCLIRVNRNILKKKIENYFYKNIYQKMKENKYDYVFVILGQSFNSKMFNDLKELNPNAKFILYLWDAVKNFPHIEDLATAFDKVFTFDNEDVVKYNYEFLPLFFNKKKEKEYEIEYDTSFVGTIKKGKLSYILKLEKELNEKYINNYFYLYLQSKLVFWYNKLLNKEFKKVKSNKFYYSKLNYEENNEIVNKSKIVIDVPMSNQNGLSMRTFECLGYSKKMITTNKNVVNYDFYRQENIYVYDGKEIDFNDIFFNSEYKEIEKEIVDKYYIENWIKILFKED